MFKIFKKESKEPQNLKEVLSHLKKIRKDLREISKELKILKEEKKFSIQKVGLVRFNPFKEIGGDQSFSVALLDDNYDGIVITSFYGREGNKVFAKPIKNGESKYLLSSEEKEAIEKTKMVKPNKENKNDENK